MFHYLQPVRNDQDIKQPTVNTSTSFTKLLGDTQTEMFSELGELIGYPHKHFNVDWRYFGLLQRQPTLYAFQDHILRKVGLRLEYYLYALPLCHDQILFGDSELLLGFKKRFTVERTLTIDALHTLEKRLKGA